MWLNACKSAAESDPGSEDPGLHSLKLPGSEDPGLRSLKLPGSEDPGLRSLKLPRV